MTHKPLVSILLPTYNHEQFIADTITSVLSQSYPHFECLILDDGSSDQTFEIAVAFAKKDRRLRCWKQKNQGVVKTLNTLAKEAGGEFIAQLGSDDLWLPHRLAWGVEDLLRDRKLAATFCSFLTVDNNLMSLKPVQPLHYQQMSNLDLVRHLVVNNHVGALTVLMRTSCLKKAGPFARDFQSIQDWELWLRLAMQGELHLRPQFGALYRWHGDNMSAHNHDIVIAETLQVLEQTSLEVIHSLGLDDEVYGKVIFRIAQLAIDANEPNRAIRALLHRADTKPLDDRESMMLFYAMVKSARIDQALELQMILREKYENFHNDLKSDFQKVSLMLANLMHLKLAAG